MRGINPSSRSLAYPPELLSTGCALGNEACYLRSTVRADLDHLWVAASGRCYFGRVEAQITAQKAPAVHSETAFRQSMICARHDLPGGHAFVEQSLFLSALGSPAAFLRFNLANNGDDDCEAEVEVTGIFAACPSSLHRRQPDSADVERAFSAEPGSDPGPLPRVRPSPLPASRSKRGSPVPVLGDLNAGAPGYIGEVLMVNDRSGPLNPPILGDFRAGAPGPLVVAGPGGERLSVAASDGDAPRPDGAGGWSWRCNLAARPNGSRTVWLALSVSAAEGERGRESGPRRFPARLRDTLRLRAGVPMNPPGVVSPLSSGPPTPQIRRTPAESSATSQRSARLQSGQPGAGRRAGRDWNRLTPRGGPRNVHAPLADVSACEGEPERASFAGPSVIARGVHGLGRHVIVGSPEPLIDAGVRWGKVCTGRVFHQYRAGYGFTNDPPGTVLVTRDVAWMIFGADYFRPHDCRRTLDTLAALAPYPSGKIAEYVDLNGDQPSRADYGLNIADPTPLFILAIHHHAAVTGDLTWMRQRYPAVLAAADYLLSQTRDGLVVCETTETRPGLNACGWRNIIDGVTISGAVTELQAESIAALTAASELAQATGDDGSSQRYREAAGTLREALTGRLLDRQTGRFRLALWPPGEDEQAEGHRDRAGKRLALRPEGKDTEYGRDDTVDQVFPILFDLAGKQTSRATLSRLLSPAYRSRFGIRCLPTDSPAYHPDAQWGLLGGIWPNASAWVAAALAPTLPGEAAALTADIARPLFDERPVDGGVLVPGQFPEWYDGDTGESKGMALSPWMGATYVWLVIERILGITPLTEGVRISPNLPSAWPAAFARRVCYRGAYLSVLVTRDAIYSTHPAETDGRPLYLGRDTSSEAGRADSLVILRQGDAIAAYLAPSSPRPITVPGWHEPLSPGELRVTGEWHR